MQAGEASSKMAKAASTRSCLPEKLWEHILKFLNDEDNNIFNSFHRNGTLRVTHHHRSFRSLSLVSKQFLSITNRLRFSVTISDATIPFLNRLFERFPNITSINITLSSRYRNLEVDLSELLGQISTFPLDLKSLALYEPIRVPANELRALSGTMKNLTSLTCYRMRFINKNDLFFIADCFPLLDELILTDNGNPQNYVLDNDDQLLVLPKLRKIALSLNFIGNHSVKDLCKNCDLLQEAKVIRGTAARYATASSLMGPQYQLASRCRSRAP
ncbi:putative F-box domain, leucine-rich repeat domain, L domain-containing protein [Medicago truncatula]|uniref:F-box protein n=1 Tax=Medicago truncatula TaxID=3880 RepID=G7JI60_MEDTR|nr:F-box protein [Medicago truncatula]RHN58538.1 putative F-box domain, leucine-rich repeat domain, L domain-containing protein [Medicago truncatula]